MTLMTQIKWAEISAELAAKTTELARHKADLEHASALLEGVPTWLHPRSFHLAPKPSLLPIIAAPL